MVATSTEAEEDTPLPSGTVEETWKRVCKLIRAVLDNVDNESQ